MDDALRRTQRELRLVSIFFGQAIAVLTAEDPVKRQALDDLLAHYEGIAQQLEAPTMMRTIRDAFDKMASAQRKVFGEDEV